eukprot:COSAG04_NODE_1043_length_8583_cov_3.464757_11_plen_67_part_00
MAAPFNIHGTDVHPRSPGPEVGVDTETVLTEQLGMSASQVEELTASGAVGAKLVPGSPIANWTAKL